MAFLDECLVDATFQRLDVTRDDYLYGEIHKGFYNTLFEPTRLPPQSEHRIRGPDNPIKFIMEAVFSVAQHGKRIAGQPVNLWITGHSLGGALATRTMARLQTVVNGNDSLIRDIGDQVGVGSTVREVMLSQFSNDPDLVVLRDCYAIGSPIVGDSSFAKRFGHNQESYIQNGNPGNRYKSVYWCIVNGNDLGTASLLS